MPISYLLPLLSHHGIKTCPIKLIYTSLKREKIFLHDIILSNKWDALRHSCIEKNSILQNTRSIFPFTVEYFLQRCPKDCTINPLQRANLLHIKLELRGLNYQTPFYANCTLKYKKNYHKIYLSVDNSCNFEVISKSNILKQIYKKEKQF
jgi:hypothetical protein